jgi:uncharacterized membrane protein
LLTCKDGTAFFVLILTASFCAIQLFIHRSLPVAHDMVFHLFQSDQFAKNIADGVILPRWVLDSNNGYGSPNFIFYAPLSYYLAALLNLIAPSPVASLILAIWCSFFLSGISMFFALKKISGRKGSLLSAMIYQLLPFHLLNLYDRGAYAELCAYAWFPLIILFMYEIISGENAPFAPIGLGLSYGGLILTHLVSAFIFSFVIGFYLIISYIYCRHRNDLLKALISLFLGLGLSSLYLIPVISERKLVQIDYIFNYVFSDFHNNFLFLPENFNARMSPFHVSLHSAALLEVFLFATLAMLIAKKNSSLLQKSHNVALIFLFILAFSLTMPLSAPLWDHLPFLSTLQFPWRWISVMEVSLCFLIGAAFSAGDKGHLMPAGLQRRSTVYCIIAIFLVSSFLIIKSTGTYTQEFLGKILTPEQVSRYSNLPREYTPVWAADVEKSVVELNPPRVSILSGKAEPRVVQWHSEKRIIGIRALTPTRLRISTFYYPGWKAAVDGEEAAISLEERTGAMLINIPQGDHTLELSFGDTRVRAFSKYVSVGSCFILVMFAMGKWGFDYLGKKSHWNLGCATRIGR